MCVRCLIALLWATALTGEPLRPLAKNVPVSARDTFDATALEESLHITGAVMRAGCGRACSGAAVAQWAFSRLLETGEAKWAELLERARLNSVPRGHLPIAYAEGEGGALYVHLYEDGAVEWRGGRLIQRTRYPYQGSVEIELALAGAAEFTVHLRIPAWTGKAEVTVMGEAVAARPGEYATVRRTWQPGDRVKLDFELVPRLIAAHPRLRSYAGRAAVMLGPLVYALQTPANVDPADLALASFNPFRPRQRRDGVTVLDHLGSMAVRPSRGQPLYQPLVKRATRRADLTLVPYVLSGESDPDVVWIPYE